MKQLTFLTKFFFLFLAISFWSSCEEDGPGGGGITIPPGIEFQSGADVITGATTVDASSTFKVHVIATSGDNDMSTFTVLEDGLEIDASRLKYNTSNFGDVSNPYTLTSGEVATFDTNIEIMAHAEGGTRTYTFRITDVAGETDDASVDITVPDTPLSLALGSGGITANATFPGAGNFAVELIAAKGGSPLSTLAVYENGTLVEASRLLYNTTNDILTASSISANPFDLIDDEKTGFNWYVWVDSHDSGMSTYKYEITDEASNTESVSLDITITPQTDVTELTGKLLSNADGPGEQGGINLTTGASTYPSATDAHLVDQGINGGAAGSNWKKTIAPSNGAELRVPAMDSPVNDYSNVQYTETISDAFDQGTIISSTGVVAIGDTYLVRDGSTTFLVYVTDVVETIGNDDYYNLSIKF